jgi:hypothetical protein
MGDIGRRPWRWSGVVVVGSDSQCREHERWMRVCELVSKVLAEMVTSKGGGAQDLVLQES